MTTQDRTVATYGDCVIERNDTLDGRPNYECRDESGMLIGEYPTVEQARSFFDGFDVAKERNTHDRGIHSVLVDDGAGNEIEASLHIILTDEGIVLDLYDKDGDKLLASGYQFAQDDLTGLVR